MYEQPLHMQRNSSTLGFNATRDLQGYLSRNTNHTVLPKLMAWPQNNSNSPAEYCRPPKRVSKETTYISSPTDWRSLTISQPHGGWFSQERRPEIKFLYQRAEVHSATKERDAHIHANDETPWYLHYVRIPQCEWCWATTGSAKTEENGHPKRDYW